MAVPAPVSGLFQEELAAEVSGSNIVELAEALVLEPSEDDYNLHGLTFTYSGEAVDRGIAGELSNEPGMIYEGPAEIWVPVTVRVRNVDVTEGTIAPEATDEVALVCYVNSTPAIEADEGFVENQANGTIIEFNMDGMVYLTDLDVVRFCLVTVEGDEGIIAQDYDVDANQSRWSLS